MKTFLQISVWVLRNSEGLSRIHLLVRQVSLYSEKRVRKKLMPYSSNFQNLLLMVQLEQVGLQKRVLMNPMCSVQQAAKENRG